MKTKKRLRYLALLPEKLEKFLLHILFPSKQTDLIEERSKEDDSCSC